MNVGAEFGFYPVHNFAIEAGGRGGLSARDDARFSADKADTQPPLRIPTRCRWVAVLHSVGTFAFFFASFFFLGKARCLCSRG